jgi:hypothetical protein
MTEGRRGVVCWVLILVIVRSKSFHIVNEYGGKSDEMVCCQVHAYHYVFFLQRSTQSSQTETLTETLAETLFDLNSLDELYFQLSHQL